MFFYPLGKTNGGKMIIPLEVRRSKVPVDEGPGLLLPHCIW